MRYLIILYLTSARRPITSPRDLTWTSGTRVVSPPTSWRHFPQRIRERRRPILSYKGKSLAPSSRDTRAKSKSKSEKHDFVLVLFLQCPHPPRIFKVLCLRQAPGRRGRLRAHPRDSTHGLQDVWVPLYEPRASTAMTLSGRSSRICDAEFRVSPVTTARRCTSLQTHSS